MLKKSIGLLTHSIIVGITVCVVILAGAAMASEVDPAQGKWHKKYKSQENAPKPEEMLLNTDSEPKLSKGFTPLFNGKDLSGWTPKGGTCRFEAKRGLLIGTCVPGSRSTYLCTDKVDFTDFILQDLHHFSKNEFLMKASKKSPLLLNVCSHLS